VTVQSAAEWVTSIPDELTLRDALVYIETALADAKAATDSIVGRYTGGTLPPPPWPQPDELVNAIKQMEGGRLLVTKGIEMGHGDDKFKKTDARAMPLLNAGRNLYKAIGAMLKADADGAINPANIPTMAINAAKKAAGSPWMTLAVVAGLIYLANKYGGDA
jgi:hypothetical protein